MADKPTQATQPITAKGVETKAEVLVIVLEDRKVSIAWQDCSPVLAAATAEQRSRAELSPGGYGIHWPLLDEDLAVDPLVRRAEGR